MSEKISEKTDKKHIIIFSHGFGVQKDDRGLLSNIAANLPEAECILFDYFDINEEEKTLTAKPFSETTKILAQVIDKAKADYPGATIDIIAHSQGTIIAALAQPEGIRKAIFLAPPFDLDIDHALNRYRSRPEAVIDLEGITKLPPLDGLTRVIPASYWRERRILRPFEIYNNFALKTNLTVIAANQDEILPQTDLKGLSPDINVLHLDGDHGFHDSARQPLIKTIQKILDKEY